MNKAVKVIINITIAIPLTLGVSYYFLYQKDQEIAKKEIQWQNEIEERKQENRELEKELETIIDEKQVLSNEMDALVRDVIDSKKRIENLDQKNTALNIQINKLQDKLKEERESGVISYSPTERQLDKLESERSAFVLSIEQENRELSDAKGNFNSFLNSKGKPLSVLVKNSSSGMVSVEEMQYALMKQSNEFRKDLELLFTAFENELESLIEGRGRKVKKRELRSSLKRVRKIYSQLAAKYQTPIFEKRINSIDRTLVNI